MPKKYNKPAVNRWQRLLAPAGDYVESARFEWEMLWQAGLFAGFREFIVAKLRKIR